MANKDSRFHIDSLLRGAKRTVPRRMDARSIIKWLRKVQIDRLKGPASLRDQNPDNRSENDQKVAAV